MKVYCSVIEREMIGAIGMDIRMDNKMGKLLADLMANLMADQSVFDWEILKIEN